MRLPGLVEGNSDGTMKPAPDITLQRAETCQLGLHPQEVWIELAMTRGLDWLREEAQHTNPLYPRLVTCFSQQNRLWLQARAPGTRCYAPGVSLTQSFQCQRAQSITSLDKASEAESQSLSWA